MKAIYITWKHNISRQGLPLNPPNSILHYKLVDTQRRNSIYPLNLYGLEGKNKMPFDIIRFIYLYASIANTNTNIPPHHQTRKPAATSTTKLCLNEIFLQNNLPLYSLHTKSVRKTHLKHRWNWNGWRANGVSNIRFSHIKRWSFSMICINGIMSCARFVAEREYYMRRP